MQNAPWSFPYVVFCIVFLYFLNKKVKFFNNSTGAATTTLGTAGGYYTSPDVTDSKFYFSDVNGFGSAQYNKLPFIAFQSDSTFWVNDPGNFRVQHFNSSNTYLNRIMSLGSTYSVHTDKNNPTRMLSELLEFEIDY